MDNLKIEYLPVEDLVPYQNNARKHTNTDVSAIAKSIEMFGFDDPIGIWKGNVIIEGHGRLMAAKQLGMETVPVIRLDHLTDEERRSYALVHNKSAELSEWDFDLLDDELDGIFDIDMSEFGFSFEDAKKEEKEKPEVEFSEILGEENNYLVLQFKTDIDWLNAQSIFGLETVKSYSTRKDGKVTKSMQRCGIARVLDGAQALKEILGEV